MVTEAIVITCKQFMANFVVSIELWTDDATFLATVDINIPKSSVHAGVDWRSIAATNLNTFLDTINASHPTSFWVAFDGELVPVSRITGLSAAAISGDYNDLINKPSAGKAYEGTTSRSAAFPIFKSVTVSSGVAVFNLTNDGTSGGNALFPNGIIADSVNVTVSDATASYQMSWAFTNSNKTLTVTANKLTTSNILTGILGQTAANSASVKLSVWGY